MKRIGAAFLALPAMCIVFIAPQTFGQTRSQIYGNTLEKQTQTLYVSADVGYATFESKAMGTNATGTATQYQIGNAAGEFRSVGFALTDTRTDINVGTTGGSASSEWTELRITYRFFFLTPFAVASLDRIQMDAGEATSIDGTALAAVSAGNTADLYGMSVGGGARFEAPLTEKIIVNGEGQKMRSLESHDRGTSSVSSGARTTINGFASLDLVENYLDLLVGYRLQNYEIVIDGQDYGERISNPYLGLRLGLYF